MPEEGYTTSERVDDLPLLVYWLLQMQVEQIIDAVLPKPHGTRQGLSYGPVCRWHRQATGCSVSHVHPHPI